MKLKKKRLLFKICALLMMSGSFINQNCFAAMNVTPLSPINNGAFDAGVLNKHQTDFLYKKEDEWRKVKDLDRFLEEKNNFDYDEKTKVIPVRDERQNFKDTTPQIEATIEKFKTEGFTITDVEIDESHILTKDEINSILAPLCGKNIFLEDIKAAIDKINNLYLEKNFITARAYIEEQSIEDGILKISLLEGRVNNFTIENNRCTRTSYINKRLNDMKMGDLLELRQLEADILQFNHVNEGITLNADLTPGEVFGTTDVRVTAKERFPVRITLATDNAGRETIGQNRFGLIGQIDSVFGYRDKLSGGAYWSASSASPFVDYNIPINKSGGRIGASFSASNMDITRGDYRIFNISGKSYATQLYAMQPIIDKPWLNLTSISSVAYKTAATSIEGYELYKDKVVTLTTGLMARHDTKRGIWYTHHNATYGFAIDSDYLENYFKYDGGIIRIHDFGHGIIGQFRGLWQYTPMDVMPSLDQFQIGGVSTVRGFSEAALIGKSGYLASAELMFPLTPTETKFKFRDKEHVLHLRNVIKGAVFVDHGGVFPTWDNIGKNNFLTSAGFGFHLALPGDLTAKFYWGFPILKNSSLAYEYMPRFHFEIMATPDIDRLIAFKNKRDMERKLKKEQKEQKEQI